MTGNQLEKVRWLNRAFYAEKAIRAWREKYQHDKAVAQRISCGLASSGARSGTNATEDALIRLAETERKTKAKISELIQMQDEIAEKITQIDNLESQVILIYRFLNYMAFDQIALRCQNYSAKVCQGN